MEFLPLKFDPENLIFMIDTCMTFGTVHKKLAKVNQKLGWRKRVSKSQGQLDTKQILDSSAWGQEKSF